MASSYGFPLYQQRTRDGALMGNIHMESISQSSDHTLTVAQLTAGIFEYDATTSALTLSTPTGTNVISAIPDAKNGDYITLIVFPETNDVSVASPPNTDVTMHGDSTLTAGIAHWFLFRVTDVSNNNVDLYVLP